MQDAIKILKDSPIAAALINVSDKGVSIEYSNEEFLKSFPNDLPIELKDKILTKENINAFSLILAATGGIGVVKITHDGDQAIVWITDVSGHVATEEAEEIARAKSNFLATMSHEIRSPMQSIYGFLELINEENISDKVRGMITTARKSSSELLEILDDILDLAKVEANKMEFDDFETPIYTLSHGVIECMKVKLFGNNVELMDEIKEDVPHVIMGDPTRIRQILLNLIGNSIKFTEHGHIKLKVSTTTKTIDIPDGEIGLRFEIEDTGIGMPQEIAADLFKPFTQADSSTSRKFGGTGLGLSISHKLTELMGGAIGVDSVEDVGSTFWVEIPTRAASEQSSVVLPDLEGIAVLSVEAPQKNSNHEILSSLTSMGASVVTAETYTDGLELVDQRPFDVAIVDQSLPDGEGIEILKYASKMRPFMGLILYTVYDDMSMQYTAKAIGARYLPKPSSRLGLGEAVKAASKKMEGHDYEGPNKLLIAEDTESVREIIKLQLDKLDIEADFVENGKEALKAIESDEYGILITDLHMPVMDGYELVKIIRDSEGGDEQNRRFPIIAITADVQLAQKQAYLVHGFDECLLKPVSLGQLKQLLVRWGVLKNETASEEEKDPDKKETVVERLIETTVEKHTTDKKAAAKETPTNDVEDDGLPPAVDRDAIISQMGGLDKSSIQMLNMFIDMTQPYIEKIENSQKSGNAHDLRENAHSLKGAARSACCPRLGDLAETIQKKAEADMEIKEATITELKEEFARVEQGIKALSVE